MSSVNKAYTILSLHFAAGLAEEDIRQKERNPEEKRTEETPAPPVHGKGPFKLMFEIISLISFTGSLIFFAFASAFTGSE